MALPKTLILVSNPNFEDSTTQKFLKVAQQALPNTTWHSLDELYKNGEINLKKERELLAKHTRIIFQFPMYWYGAPSLLKKWEDEVLTRNIVYKEEMGLLKGKELGIVLSVGNPLSAFQAGGLEEFSISQLTIPYQALAKRSGMKFIKTLVIPQFNYMTVKQKQTLLVNYMMYLSNNSSLSFKAKQTWLIKALNRLKISNSNNENKKNKLNSIIETLDNNENELSNLKDQLRLIKNDEEQTQ